MTSPRVAWCRVFPPVWIVPALLAPAVRAVDSNRLGAAAAAGPGAALERYDRNGDGRLARDEVPERAAVLFDRVDRDRDGVVTRAELGAALAARSGGEGGAPRRAVGVAVAPPTERNVAYGPHERNVFDFWRAAGEGPRPLVVFFHGGGFRAGDKSRFSPGLLSALLSNGISFAAANYRLTDSAPFPAPMRDAARAIQFLRLHAAERGVDPQRIGLTGGSAGAGISLWLLFHTDLADPGSSDPVARQSSRPTCAAVTGAQSSYDPRFVSALFKTTNSVLGVMRPFFGLKPDDDPMDPKFGAMYEEASPLHHASADDGPCLLYYSQPNAPLGPDPGWGEFIHHPRFGIVLKEKLDRLGVPCEVRYRNVAGDQKGDADRLPDASTELVRFFVRHLRP